MPEFWLPQYEEGMMGFLDFLKGKRVKVTAKDGRTSLGQGTIRDAETIEVGVLPSGEMVTPYDGVRLNGKELAALALAGGHVIELPDNPKIELDAGDVVRGSEVWWDPID